MHDCLIIGGGVIGLSLAYELAGHGATVHLVDRGQPGHEASWAGAGILPPGGMHPAANPAERLAHLSERLHAEWAEQLRSETGIDNGYRRCGAVYLAESEAEATRLAAAATDWAAGGIATDQVTHCAVGGVGTGFGSGD